MDKLKIIREAYFLLNNLFDEVELDTFCLLFFPTVHKKSQGQKKNAKLNQLFEYCRLNLPELFKAMYDYENEMPELAKFLKDNGVPKPKFEIQQPQPRAPGERDRFLTDLDGKFPEINFEQPLEQLETILKKYKTKAAAALFLLPECTDKKGEWLVKRLQKKLIDHLHHEAKVRHIPVDIYDSLTLFNLLKGLGSHLNCPPTHPNDVSSYAKAMIEVMHKSLELDKVVLCEVNIASTFSEEEMFSFFNSFLQEFWQPLISKWSAIATESSMINWIVILAVDETPPEPCLLLCCDSIAQFSSEKIFRLPLTNWSKEEIWDWLQISLGLPTLESKKLAEEIYQGSRKGEPLKVETILRKRLPQYMSY